MRVHNVHRSRLHPLFLAAIYPVMASLISTFVAHYGLTEEYCKREVSDSDIIKITRSLHGKWKSQLPPLLEMDPIVVTDIVGAPGYMSDEDKRLAFFKEWKQRKGFNATYKALISALLEIECRQDAGSVCKILKKTTAAAPDQASYSTNTTSIPSSSVSTPFPQKLASVLSTADSEKQVSMPTLAPSYPTVAHKQASSITATVKPGDPSTMQASDTTFTSIAPDNLPQKQGTNTTSSLV